MYYNEVGLGPPFVPRILLQHHRQGILSMIALYIQRLDDDRVSACLLVGVFEIYNNDIIINHSINDGLTSSR